MFAPAFGILAKKNIKKKKKKKSKKRKKDEKKVEKKNPNKSHIPFLALWALFQYPFVSSEHRQMRQAIILFVTLGTSPLLCGVCVDPILSSATVLISPLTQAFSPEHL